MRMILLFLALAGGFALTGCHITFRPVDLNAIENPRQLGSESLRPWSEDYPRRRVSRPDDR